MRTNIRHHKPDLLLPPRPQLRIDMFLKERRRPAGPGREVHVDVVVQGGAEFAGQGMCSERAGCDVLEEREPDRPAERQVVLDEGAEEGRPPS